MIAIISILQGALIQNTFAQPQISDPQLKVDIVAKGLTSPATMAFLNTTDILVLEKDGNVRRVTNGMLQEKPGFAGKSSNRKRKRITWYCCKW